MSGSESTQYLVVHFLYTNLLFQSLEKAFVHFCTRRPKCGAFPAQAVTSLVMKLQRDQKGADFRKCPFKVPKALRCLNPQQNYSFLFFPQLPSFNIVVKSVKSFIQLTATVFTFGPKY